MEGTIRILDHCTFHWRRRVTEYLREVAVEPAHCAPCVQALRAIAVREGFVLPGGTRMEGRSPSQRHVLREEAAAATKRRDYARAAELYLRLIELDPENPGWAMRAGEAELRAGQRDRAADRFGRAARQLAARGLAAKARAMCQLALELDAGRDELRSLLDGEGDPQGGER